ncbi:MAG: hypothetical protein VR64_22345 [Desulfatitalea sp. BRH_c12]|nr:MAG: hypothetical protein VR64_22345 [Desulfatitalea sp. BRH_c12]
MFVSLRQLLEMSPYGFIPAALIGCAGAPSNPSAVPPDILRPGYAVVYYPAIRTGANFDSAK